MNKLEIILDNIKEIIEKEKEFISIDNGEISDSCSRETKAYIRIEILERLLKL